ncbi:MAG TPA: nuclear transport factor 2 family protein, partial [Mycobacteriales bacterium]|nr:nuclear transport factor 2 family protein [Mycobacteriales bacterium]
RSKFMGANAHEEIRNLLGRYCELMDAGDFAGLASLFSDGRLADDAGNVFAVGAEQIQAMWERQTMTYDGSPRTRHITANPVIEVDESNGTATCSSSYVVFQGVDDFGFQPIVSGRYNDRFTRGDDATWRFTERRYAVDHVGDLSHHLRMQVTES